MNIAIPFNPARLNNDGERLLMKHKRAALHVEPLKGGFALAVQATGYFEFSVHEGVQAACLKIFLGVSHFGQVITRWDRDFNPFEPVDDTLRHIDYPCLSVGGREVRVGFSGKSVSEEGHGWLPGHLHILLDEHLMHTR